jgi:alkylhydroperoxidase family enzyme
VCVVKATATHLEGDMTSETRVPKADITGVYGRLVKMMTRRMLGQVPDSIGVMWQQPKVFKVLMGFGRKVDKWGALEEPLATYATMAAVGRVGCGFCLDFGYFMAHSRHLDEAKVRQVPRWRESDVFSVLECQVMEYAEAMSQTPPTVTDELSAGLLAQLGPAAMVELAARVAAANLTARANIALGIRSQEFSAACGLPPLATPSADVASAP